MAILAAAARAAEAAALTREAAKSALAEIEAQDPTADPADRGKGKKPATKAKGKGRSMDDQSDQESALAAKRALKARVDTHAKHLEDARADLQAKSAAADKAAQSLIRPTREELDTAIATVTEELQRELESVSNESASDSVKLEAASVASSGAQPMWMRMWAEDAKTSAITAGLQHDVIRGMTTAESEGESWVMKASTVHGIAASVEWHSGLCESDVPASVDGSASSGIDEVAAPGSGEDEAVQWPRALLPRLEDASDDG